MMKKILIGAVIETILFVLKVGLAGHHRLEDPRDLGTAVRKETSWIQSDLRSRSLPRSA